MKDENPSLYGCSREELRSRLKPYVDRSYRIDQIHTAIFEHGIRRWDRITTLSRDLRRRLARDFRLDRPEVVDRRESKDGTVKHLFRLSDGASVEAVDIPEGDRRTLCISSQSGCPLACRFCVTGYWGAGRNLTSSEIVAQVLAICGRMEAQDSLNLVFMGMGEPLLNLEEVRGAIETLTEWISWRRITLSTVGILPALERLAAWERRPNLAVSLHAPDDERRSELMPVNRRYPLGELLEFLRGYPLERGRKITIEYVLIRGFNDSPEDASALAALLRNLRVKVNLIPLNPDPALDEEMVPPEAPRVEAFRDRVEAAGLVATVRARRGDDVSAACGQLRAFDREPRSFPPR
ncbi:MAG: 23S rRNA (adenine(2503)-C(2))-methyltransferase RlmN [Thermoanaerobaculia bacterium]|nr:23S rRNA (adenine(2503)-C(2))-methyltransferase RlmN [Thermoanaerobaculia bacterium]